jgi:hypothetical protein
MKCFMIEKEDEGCFEFKHKARRKADSNHRVFHQPNGMLTTAPQVKIIDSHDSTNILSI